ncbi:receptor-like protein 33 [Jatropha curcas]|uniref:receptor-like protein 33 n=1 Tax=Jatropha curcas TaxID=180498 RepID=UPI001895B23B|nr:receptor-like protein 33 [Jatropha curcas]
MPSFLANLTRLETLDLAKNQLIGVLPSWIANLTQLDFLDLGSNDLQGSFPTSISGLKNLRTLNLAANYFNGTLDLDPDGLSQLNYLDLGFNQLTGEIPSFLANLTRLQNLDLDSNQLIGQLPFWLMNLTQLSWLTVAGNRLHGTIPIPSLVNIESLSLRLNNFVGNVELHSFFVLKNLKYLYLGGNNLSLITKKSNNSTSPKFINLDLSSCNLTEFPDFLQNQNQLTFLDLSFNNMKGRIPKWLLNISIETLACINFSHNLLTNFVQTPVFLPWSRLQVLSINSNQLQSSSLPIPVSSILYYSASNNSLAGEMPKWFCKLSSLQVLDLSNNKFSGMLPQWLGNFSVSLSVLNLEKNSFTGTIPDIWTRSELRMIKLGRNKLHGKIPKSLAKCTMLESVDLGNNQLNDTFPLWLVTLSELEILIIRFNRFHGTLLEICKSDSAFPKLRIIDLSSNNFSGKFPVDCFLRWNAMRVVDSKVLKYMGVDIVSKFSSMHFGYAYSIIMTNKGVEREYPRVVEIFSAIDISCNKFEGEIPELIGILKGLRSLNLSKNALTGHIPLSIVNLTNLENLDLSRNMLSGPIPQELKQLTFLSKFDVAYNHLTGPIPQGKQFDTFPNNSYDGNSGLCGSPLTKSCEYPDSSPAAPKQNHHSGFLFEFGWEVVLMGYGCGFVLGLVIGHFVTERKKGWFAKTCGVTLQKRRRR